MLRPLNTPRILTAAGARRAPQPSENAMDFVMIAVGAGMFALFAVYAALLRRV
jgi:hypothetical protein